jgi:biopolymer transport protein ExbD
MGRFRDETEDDGSDTAIDMSPLIDCVFILLIFFIVTTVFVEEPGVEVTKTNSSGAEDLEKNSIIIAVTNRDEVVYGGRQIGVKGVYVTVKPFIDKDKNTPVIVQVDENASSEVAIDVVGEAKLAGAARVSYSTEKK